MKIPFIRPTPPRLSNAGERLRQIEDSGIFSNFGPVNTEFEQKMLASLFAGQGACMTVCNATIGLMLGIQQAIGERPVRKRYALMPSFTFAATAHAAMWCGLTPLFCDIDPVTWTPCAADEDRLLAQYGDDIAVVVPYATFGYDIDLSRYEEIQRRGTPVVVDAAASLGTVSSDGNGFGTGFSGTVVFSMHATKSFSSGEAGLVYSADSARIAVLRQMCNFGFGQPRTTTMPGLNGKLSEVGALLGLLRLEDYPSVMARRTDLVAQYRSALGKLTFQPQGEARQAHQFVTGLLPQALAGRRPDLSAALTARGIGSASYFSPHLTQQAYFAKHGVCRPLPVTEDVANRIISLPLFDTMTEKQVDKVTKAVSEEIERLCTPSFAQRPIIELPPIQPLPVAAMVNTIEPAFTSNYMAS